AVESLRQNAMRLQHAPDRAAQPDDRVVISIKSLETENAKPNRYMLVVGKTFGELDNLLAGMREGETKQATLTFPDSFDDPDFAGKTLLVEVGVQRISVPVYPDIDDEFARDAGYDDLNALREALRARITEQKLQYLRDQAQDQALAILRERSTIILPEALIEEQLQEELREFADELRTNGLTLESFLQQTGMTQQQLLEQLRARATVRLQNTFILMEIAEREGITVEEAEVDTLVREMASAMQRPITRVRILEDKDLRQRVRNELRLERALQKLFEITQTTEEGA
ncbi:MAG: hypothetical protein RMK45_09585, partial [Armatimonadota bacterium]|nr:hypothetical protein [Armatimonadota bacterium]